MCIRATFSAQNGARSLGWLDESRHRYPRPSPINLTSASLLEAFADLPDPRRDHLRCYDLIDLLALTLIAVVCGCDSWLTIAEFGTARLQ